MKMETHSFERKDANFQNLKRKFNKKQSNKQKIKKSTEKQVLYAVTSMRSRGYGR